VRTLPGQDQDYIMGQIRAALGDEIYNDKVKGDGGGGGGGGGRRRRRGAEGGGVGRCFMQEILLL